VDPEDKNLESKLPEGVTTYGSTGAFFLFAVVGGASSRAVLCAASFVRAVERRLVSSLVMLDGGMMARGYVSISPSSTPNASLMFASENSPSASKDPPDSTNSASAWLPIP
jgi:hypothetical protein